MKWILASGALVLGPLLLVAPASARASPIHSPPSGSVERTAILDAIRPQAESELGGPVKFVVKAIRVSGAYAYVDVRPQKPNGQPYRIRRPDWMDAYADAILIRRGTRWSVLQFVLGAGDVWYGDYCGRVPDGLLDHSDKGDVFRCP